MVVCLAQSMVQRSGRWLLPFPTALSLVYTRAAGGTPSPSVAQPSTSQDKIRTEDDLPRIKTREMLYRLYVQGYYKRLHELQVYEKQLYGPMYKIGVGSINSVVLNSVELLEELLRKDERFPSRGDMSLWTDYRDLRGIGYGPFTEEGVKWYNLRTVLNKRMLHPKDSVQYGDVVNEVVSDLIKRIYHLRRTSPTGDRVNNLSNELYRFSLEGISSILFETRIGCLEEEIPVETQHFIDSIAQMFSYSLPVAMLPKWSRNILPFYGRYIAGWEGIFKFSVKFIEMKMEAIQKRVDTNQEVEGEYLTYLLSNTKMTNKEVYGSVAELLLAGVDTTSNTMMWAMYLLSRDSNVQNTLYQEVSRCVPGDNIPSAQDVNCMPYLKAVIKETLRMYPVVPLNSRIMAEKDVIIGGHFFPKKTSFTMCHYAISQDEKTFPEPSKFKPERWLRDGRVRPNPFGSIPFGFGVRGCVGRRIAELEMYLALSRIIKLFEIRPDPSIREVKALNRSVLVADRQVNLHFLERTDKAAL
ncbi:sterol 26-hydroxylase, mitochondrial isoform X1 [Oncorhynchus mykiss]|uniref:Sterol 26-hydroxylase, mitochondrial-like n=1 Tax=Oncorhynchus mykiss TaxID=8022 RepID=A0A8C7Q3A7_ONCMY|nr:sterol 26-hydroxylase, mitochondrial isoform X1 [Oncorhynchus mykiss]